MINFGDRVKLTCDYSVSDNLTLNKGLICNVELIVSIGEVVLVKYTNTTTPVSVPVSVLEKVTNEDLLLYDNKFNLVSNRHQYGDLYSILITKEGKKQYHTGMIYDIILKGNIKEDIFIFNFGEFKDAFKRMFLDDFGTLITCDSEKFKDSKEYYQNINGEIKKIVPEVSDEYEIVKYKDANIIQFNIGNDIIEYNKRDKIINIGYINIGEIERLIEVLNEIKGGFKNG